MVSVNHLGVRARQHVIVSSLLIITVVGFLSYAVVYASSSKLSSNAKVTQTVDLMPSQWKYLPGSNQQNNGLLINASDFKIVQQDGSGGQANPPVNLYGPHLNVGGAFSVNATLVKTSGTSTLQFYGSVPIVQDEFRVEPASIRVDITGNQATIIVWNDAKNVPITDVRPSSQKQYTIAGADSYHVSVHRHEKQIDVTINGKQIAQLNEQGIFRKGEVWFGASNIGGSDVLESLTASAYGNGRVQIVNPSKMLITQQSGETLQSAASAKRPGFKIGAAVALAPLSSDQDYRALALNGNFGSVTTENALKWQFVEPQPNAYDFHETDAIVDQALYNNIAVHGHTLVFGEANPAWVQQLPIKTAADKQHVTQVMTDHINTVMSRYKGKITSWDVVNEPLADYDDFNVDDGHALRNHIWYQAQGSQYIPTAFAAAHAADPDAKLYINEYGLEADGERWDVFLALVTKLKKQNVPIDGVGFESHVYSADDKIDPVVLQKHISQLAAIGLTSRVSEIDVYSEDGTAVQATQYAGVLQACLAQPTCVSYTTWGITARYDLFQDDDGSLQRGQDLLWDARLRPTPAVPALYKVLR